MGYLLSIVIPTKERYKYLLPLIELIDGYKLKDTEIVIEDNSVDNTVYENYIKENVLTTPIVYNHSEQSLPICENIDNAIRHSSGEYVCVIGDDDGLMPTVIDVVNKMKSEKIESVRQKYEITYKWPAFSDERNVSNKGATLKFVPFRNLDLYVDPIKASESVIRGLFSSLGNCPCVYQGIVSRAVLDKLYEIGHTYTPGPSPDMANSMALSYIVKKHLVIDSPVIISGGSEYQGGKNKKIRSLVQPLENITFISEEDKKKWDKRIPYFWCETTVWPESGLKGLEYVGKEDKGNLCDFEALLAKLLCRCPDRKKEIKEMSKNVVLLYFRHFLLKIRSFLVKVKWLLVRFGLLKSRLVTIAGVNDMKQVVSILSHY